MELLLLIIVTALVSLLSGSFSTAALVAVSVPVALLLSGKVSGKKASETIKVYYIALSVFLGVSFFCYLEMKSAYSRFEWINNDQYRFWLFSQEGFNVGSISQLFTQCIIDNVYYENGGYYFYICTLNYLAQLLFGENGYQCMMLQLTGTAIPGALVGVFMMPIFDKYCIETPRRKVLIFLILSAVLVESTKIHRDMHIALAYSITFYLGLVKGNKPLSICLQFLVAYITYYFREQHGLLMVAIIFFNFYINTDSRYRLLSLLACGLVAIGTVMYYGVFLHTLRDTNSYYEQYLANQMADYQGGVGGIIQALPSPLRQVCMVLQSQFSPCPPWFGYTRIISWEGLVQATFICISSIFWFKVFYLCSCFYYKKYRELPHELMLYFLVFLGYICLNISNLEARRLLAFYPIAYLVFVYFKQHIIDEEYIRRQTSNYYKGVGIACVAYIGLKLVI